MLKQKKYSRAIIESMEKKTFMEKKKLGPAETWTRIFGFKVQGAHHYTTGPAHVKALPNAISTVAQRTRAASNHIRNQIPLWISYCGRVGGLCDEEVWLTFVYPSGSAQRHVKDVYAIQKATVYWIITLNVGQESCCSLPTCTGDVKEREGDVGGTRQGFLSMCVYVCMCAGKSMCPGMCVEGCVWRDVCGGRTCVCVCGRRQKRCCNEVESVHSTVATNRWWLLLRNTSPCIYTNMHNYINHRPQGTRLHSHSQVSWSKVVLEPDPHMWGVWFWD